MDNRINKIEAWLTTFLSEPLLSLSPASADASFRRYFRAKTKSTSYIVMDAPPEQEPLDSFIAIDRALIKQEVHAPIIILENIEDGFLLLEDLGDITYLTELHKSADVLYTQAINSLIKIQLGIYNQTEFDLPAYDQTLAERELDLFEDWYCKEHLNISLSDKQQGTWLETKQFLINNWLVQPIVWVHRDYHSRNLMLVNNNSPAVIDFQDMVRGPISYDLASLFKDCYIEWPRDKQLQWLTEYLEQANTEFPNLQVEIDQLVRWFDLTGLQRHLKVLGIFSRLNYRDGKSNYLDDIPLVKKYVSEVCLLYPELFEFSLLFTSLNQSDK